MEEFDKNRDNNHAEHVINRVTHAGRDRSRGRSEKNLRHRSQSHKPQTSHHSKKGFLIKLS